MEESTINHLLIVGGVLGGLLIVAPGLIWLERRLLSALAGSLWPKSRRSVCMFIVLADAIKLFFKEDWISSFC